MNRANLCLAISAALTVSACAPIPTNPVPYSARYLQVTEKGNGVIVQLDLQNAEWCRDILQGTHFAPTRSGECSVYSRAKSLDWSATAAVGIDGPELEIRTRNYSDCNLTYQRIDYGFSRDKPRQWFWKEVCMERPA